MDKTNKKLSFTRVSRIVRQVARQGRAELALLFGSIVRGTATEHSDIDIIIVETTRQRYLKRLDKYFGTFCQKFNGGVDLFVYTPAEFERMKKGSFVGRALREGKIVYERRKVKK